MNSAFKEFKLIVDKNTSNEIIIKVSGTRHLSMFGNTIFSHKNEICELPSNCNVTIIINGDCKEINNANNIAITIYGKLLNLYNSTIGWLSSCSEKT